ncbi:TOBE domain-containing protein [Campylobacter mucosalis]|uniref:TOBE domain-containing protein n=1 Tax=Campylobacter mucosalis TaxID=202 RepID=UPI0014706311|nr:hypothetical protein [Campylobacter mucosalis]
MIEAKVERIVSKDEMSYVIFSSDIGKFSMLSLENLELKPLSSVKLGFKSSDVFLSRSKLNECSVKNEILCTIKRIERGEIIACVHLSSFGYEFESIISSDSCTTLFKEGEEVFAYIKSTSIFISSFDDKH